MQTTYSCHRRLMGKCLQSARFGFGFHAVQVRGYRAGRLVDVRGESVIVTPVAAGVGLASSLVAREIAAHGEGAPDERVRRGDARARGASAGSSR